MESHLLQMRGLKPFVLKVKKPPIRSHLLQMRGLKPSVAVTPQGTKGSHLLQMRGLKQAIYAYRPYPYPVASFTDAWIETPKGSWNSCLNSSRIFYRCVD